MIRREYLFTGTVQGVGFRYRACHAASLLGISGWVKNNDDGSVSVQAQGSRDALQHFTDLIEQGRYICVERCTSKEIPVLASEHGFYIADA